MLSFIARDVVKPQIRRLYMGTTRFLALSAAKPDGVYAVRSVSKNEHDCLVIKWSDDKVDEYPYMYLRENCRCSACYKDERKSRTMYSPKDVDLNITARSASWSNDDNLLKVNWEDGHISYYSSEWLKHLRYRPPGEGQPNGVMKKDIQLWGDGMTNQDALPTFQFDKLLDDEEEMYKWLVTLATQTGLAKVENAPKEPGQVIKLGERVGWLTQTSYGLAPPIKAFSDHGTHETGYSYSSVPMHTDFAFSHVVPAVGMFHCVQQTEGDGGANLWVDGFHAANLLHEENPEAFQILATTPVAFRNYKSRFGSVYHQSHHTSISVDRANKVTQTCYSDEFRDTHMPVEPRQMNSFYKSYFRYSELLADRRTSFWYKMKSGDIMTLNNHRVFHGRSEYREKGDPVRFIETAFVDWDCVHSRIRIFAGKQGLESPVD